MPAENTRVLPVRRLSAKELHEELVADAVKHVATPLPRFVEAVQRIAQLRGEHPEKAYQDIVGEVEELTGSRGMPML